MRLHQIITGSTNTFQGQATFSVGTLDGLKFTAFASGCDLVIVANELQRVQIIPGVTHGHVQVTGIDCSSDSGRIAASYGNKVSIYDPIPLAKPSKVHQLSYQWHETASIEADCFVTALSWHPNGTSLITGGEYIQYWMLETEENADLFKRVPKHFETSLMT